MIGNEERLRLLKERSKILELMKTIAQAPTRDETERNEALKELGKQSQDLKVKIQEYAHK